MNRNNSYREKLLYFLDRDEEQEDMLDWIDDLPELDQPDVLRLLASLLKERTEKTGEKEWIEMSNQLAENIDKYEEEILDKKLLLELLIMELEGVKFDIREIEVFLIKIREDLIEKMASVPENYKELKKLAKLAIENEKSFGLYDSSNWTCFL